MKNQIKLLVTSMPETTTECPFSYTEINMLGNVVHICSFSKKTCYAAGMQCEKLEPVTMPGCFDNEADSREEAYQNYLTNEEYYEEKDRNIISFEKFCEELDKGYGYSDILAIARLYEKADGRIYYDTEYVG